MSEHPYDRLGPDMVIDAVESAGYLSDARLLALNSYENRVYQVGMEQGEPLILISHNMRQVFDLVDRIVVFRRGRIVANLLKSETDPQDVVAYITGAKTGAEYAGAA